MIWHNEKWTKWIPPFIFAAILMIGFKVLGNFSAISGFFENLLSILTPFLIGILIVYILYIPCMKIEKIFKKSKKQFVVKHARPFSVLSVYLILLSSVALLITLIAPIIVDNVKDLALNFPAYYNHIISIVPEDLVINDANVREQLSEFSTDFMTGLFTMDRIGELATILLAFGTTIFHIFIGLIFSAYFLLEREKIRDFSKRLSRTLFKKRGQVRIAKYAKQINDVLFTFIASKGLDSLINFVVVTTILLLFGARYAVLLGFIAGIANFIPYLGSLIAVIFISFVTLITNGIAEASFIAIALVAFQQLDANFIEPKIMSRNLKISPLLVIFSVIVGGAYFGIPGMFLGVPVAVIIKQLLVEYMAFHEKDNKPEAKKLTDS